MLQRVEWVTLVMSLAVGCASEGQDIAERVGGVGSHTGRADAAYVEERPLRRVASDFRYDTYLASISAMNFGGGEIRVRETDQSLPIAAR
jgi:hypothetical protein